MANHRIVFSGLICHVNPATDVWRAALLEEPKHFARMSITDGAVTDSGNPFKLITIDKGMRIYDITNASLKIDTGATGVVVDQSFDTRVPHLKTLFETTGDIYDEVKAGKDHLTVHGYANFTSGLLTAAEGCYEQEVVFSPKAVDKPRCLPIATVLTVSVPNKLRILDEKTADRYVDINVGAEIRITNESGAGNHWPLYGQLSKGLKERLSGMLFTGGMCIRCVGVPGHEHDEEHEKPEMVPALSPTVQCTNSQWP